MVDQTSESSENSSAASEVQSDVKAESEEQALWAQVDAQREAANFKHSTGACARAIANDADFNIAFDDEAKDVDVNSASMPAIVPGATTTERNESRGRSDSIALHQQFHDNLLHTKVQPKTDTSQRCFALAEQTRIELLGGREYGGIAHNLNAALEKRYRSLNEAMRAQQALSDDSAGQRLGIEHALSLYLREQLGTTLPPSAKSALEPWRDWLKKEVSEKFEEDTFSLSDQAQFAKAFQQLLKQLNMDAGDEQGEGDDDDFKTQEDAEDSQSSDQDDSRGEDDALSGMDDSDASDSGEEEEGQAEDGGDAVEPDEIPEDSSSNPGSQWRPEPGSATSRDRNEYFVYTTEFDEIIKPGDLCSIDELNRLREQLDQHLGDLQKLVGRFANKLQRVLLAQQTRSWDFDQEEGQLDCARLTRVLTDPMMPLTFKQERDTDFRDTVVTLLLDNSGSMHGRSIRVAAVCADILSATLERCGVKVEVLGFTTVAWKGGHSRERWVEAGYPPNPGRLNDLRHIVYKSADAPYRQSKRNLGLMMRKGLLKENIDGEALQWAYSRLLQRPEHRKIIMMISDGAPIDDSTLSTNSGRFLEKHLRLVIGEIERQNQVELLAIGIGHDVGQYYQNAATIHDVSQLADAMTRQLVELFTPHSSRVES